MNKVTVRLSLCFLALFLASSLKVEAQTWSFTGNMNVARTYHTATLLNNGQVLVASGRGVAGNNGTQLQSTAEIYNPATGTFSKTGNVNTARMNHGAALLPNGDVLIVGGFGQAGCLSSAELYNPSTGKFAFTGSLSTGYCSATATLLNTGKVLVINGTNAALYDPSSGTFSNTGSLNVTRGGPTTTLLANGQVLVAGGQVAGNTRTATAELYNPATGKFTLTGSMHTSRDQHTATLMNNGEVLIAGGFHYIGPQRQIQCGTV